MSASRDFADHPSTAAFDAAAALNALDDACVVVSPQWRVLFANAAFVRAAGAGARCGESQTGAELWTAFPPLAARAPAGLLRASMVDGRRRACRLPLADAAETIYEMNALPMPGGGLCIQLRNISDAVHSERELAERMEENISLSEVARMLAAEVDLPDLLSVICRAAMTQCDATSAVVGEIEGDEIAVVARAGAAESLDEMRLPLDGSLAARAVAAREPVRSADYRTEHPHHAAYLPLSEVAMMMGAPLIAHDQVMGVLLVGRGPGAPAFGEREVRRVRVIADHAALAIWKTRLLERVQEANREKSEFMATMSHELRTPLTALTGYEELLADEVFGPLSDQQHGALDRMRSSTELLTVIIDEVLTFSRLETGQVIIHPHQTTAQEILRATGAVLEPLALEKRLDLSLVAPDLPLELITDADMVRRILVNLGANAVKFTEHGSVMIEAKGAGDEVAFAVRDTGIGIARADLSRLFRPFAQLETGLTRRYGGTGLGLFISQQLAELLGGRIEVESTVGVGSTFTLLVPATLTAPHRAG